MWINRLIRGSNRRLNRQILLIFVFTFSFSAVSAQKVAGYVKDIKGNPIGFVAVMIEGTSIGTSTDSTGFFTLALNGKSEADLIFRCVGFEESKYSYKVSSDKQKIIIYLKPKESILNTIVITEMRTERKIKDTPTLTKVISEAELKEIGAVTVLDALENLVPGMYFNPNSHGDNIQMQGLENKYILVLLNGERVVNGRTENVNFARLNVADIERIEMIDGAASVLYGSNAIGAVINIITKEVAKPVEAFVQGRYSNFNSYTLDAALGLKFKKFTSKTVFNTKGTDGYTVGNGDTNKNGETQLKIVKPNSDYSIRQELKYQFNKKIDAQIYGSYYDLLIENPLMTTDQKERDYNIGAKLNAILSEKNVLSITANNDFYKNYNVLKNKNGSLYLKDSYTINSLTATDVWTPSASVQVVGGYEFNNEESYSSYFDSVPESKSAYNNNLFAQGEFKFLKKFNAVVGARVTQHSEFGTHFTPKISVMYSLKDFRFRAGVSNGFKAPTLKELYYNFDMGGVAHIQGNPDLKPEESWYESVSAEYISGKFNSSVTVYNNNITNKINSVDYVGNQGELPIMKFENVDDVQIQGIDISLQWNFLKYLYLNGAYAFANAVDKSTDEELTGNSKHNITSALMFKNSNFKIQEKEYPFSVVFLGRFSSPRTYYNFTKGVTTLSKTTSIWRLVYTQGFPKLYKDFGIELQLGIDNIFNWTDAAKSVNPGRTYFAALRMNI